jgi:uncharacterized protein (DUF736 family)
VHLAQTDLIGFCHHAKIELAVSDLLHIRLNDGISFNANGAQSSLTTSTILLVHISSRIRHSPLGLAQSPVSQACPQRPTSVQIRSRNPVAPVFSPPQMRLLANAALQKTGAQGPPLTLRPRGSGSFWHMNGQASPEEQSSKRNQMENIMTAIGYVTKQTDGRYKGTLRTVSIKADIDILPNMQKTSDSQPDFRVVTEGIEIGAGWTRKGETSNKEYVSLSIAAPEFGPKKLYANLGKAAGSDDKDFVELSFDYHWAKCLPQASFQYLHREEGCQI